MKLKEWAKILNSLDVRILEYKQAIRTLLGHPYIERASQDERETIKLLYDTYIPLVKEREDLLETELALETELDNCSNNDVEHECEDLEIYNRKIIKSEEN